MNTTPPRAASGPDLGAARQQVDSVLVDFLARKTVVAAAQRLPTETIEALADFIMAGGKRLRPTLCAAGWHAAAGQQPPPKGVLQVAASLEMFHAFCLIHDDIMDHSPTRRGRPTVHRALADRHITSRPQVLAEQFGNAAAILIGDLALIWSDELIHTAGLALGQLTTLLPLLDAMRAEVVYGQYLDLTGTGRPTDDIGQALTVIHYKTAKYTVERPLHIGAALAGADGQFLAELSRFALPLGEAFQLRDDLLGVFGDPQRTGKPALDDLREGKHTVLVALALQAADDAQKRLLHTLYGSACVDEEDAEAVRAVLRATGADQAVERMITERYEQALTALGSLPAPAEAHSQLRALADRAVCRTS
ncbi:polyprenyl synthetase family protein [Streptomyces sp. NPDC004435]|uniref:polyprenyl synthetase family protein n=1 Tax=Streptomyces sp. NPDC004435 TaxID=3364701 RepID=UPI00369C1170